MNNRIRSSNVQLGESMVISGKSEAARERERQEHKILLDKMLLEANAEVEKAQQKAVEIVQKAEEEAAKKAVEIEDLTQQAIEKGYVEGFQKGRDEGIAEVKEKVWGIDVLTSASFRVKKEIIDSAEKEILQLSTAIAEKIIRQELEASPEIMQKIIRSAIDQLTDKEEIKIIVNPALAASLYDFAEEVKQSVRGVKVVKLNEDRTIPRDGVIVESPDSRIDARIETQIGEIVRNMMQEFTEKSNSEDISEEINIKIDETTKKSKKEE